VQYLHNKQLKRTKYVVIVFAKKRKKAANKFCPLAGRYMQILIKK
jgi:hypothetical protein